MITGNVKEGSSAPAGPMVRYGKPPSGVAPGGEDKHTNRMNGRIRAQPCAAIPSLAATFARLLASGGGRDRPGSSPPDGAASG